MACSNNGEDKIKSKELVPRPYQLQILEYAVQRNCIIYLPTGSGKTFVAIMAIKRFSTELQKPPCEGGKRIIFMCNTVELARQQFQETRKLTNLRCGFYVGERDVDSWDKNKWVNEIKEHQVMIGTCQVFVDMIVHKYLKITDLSLVIIDECHHGTKAHAMHQFMSQFQYADSYKPLPRVIGLTGVLLKSGKVDDIVKQLRDLESTFRGNIITVKDIDNYHNVLLYSTRPTEEFVIYPDNGYIFDVVHHIEKYIEECKKDLDMWELGSLPEKLTKGMAAVREPNKVKQVKNLLADFVYQMQDFGLYAASIAIMSPIIEFEIKKRQAPTMALRKMYRFVITKCEYIRHIIIKKLNSLTDDDDDDEEDKSASEIECIMNFSTPKLQSLLQYFQKKFEGKSFDDISCLIFVQRRYSAKCLYYVIKNFTEALPSLRKVIIPHFMVGRNASIQYGIDAILERKWNTMAVDMFRTKKCNLIVCSSVLEEGIDVQSCNYVFAFDPLKQFSSYIQTKGRARSSTSLYSIFCSKSQQTDVATKIKLYREVDTKLKNYLINRTVDQDPTEYEISNQFIEHIRPFETKSGTILQAQSALTLLNRYIMTLPTDAFGLPPGWWSVISQPDGKFIVSLKLPLQSTVKENILSDPMKTRKSAKVSAAFKACILLYQNGELNERLLPVTKQECVRETAKDFFKKWGDFASDKENENVGTNKNRRLYSTKCPKELNGALPTVGQPCYAYVIYIKPKFEIEPENEHIIKMLNSSSNYGILIRNKLPKLASMPLYMTQGELNIEIAYEPIVCVINSSEEMELLYGYHLMLMRDLLKIWKNFFVMDRRNEQNSYLIVPISGSGSGTGGNIDWQLVKNFQRLSIQKPSSTIERSMQKYIPEDYLGKVVNTWYTMNDETRFVVVKIRNDMTPMSPFANDQFLNFVEYIENKYQEQIVNKQQFMLEVKAITSRTNFYVNSRGKDSTGKKNRNRDAVFLVPEMVHNFKYPGDMWLKAIFLPCIMHRLQYLLLAEELRVRLNDFLKIVDNNYKPKPLMVDMSLKRTQDNSGDLSKEPKSMLPSLQTTRHEVVDHVKSLLDDDEGAWKSYMEPVNFNLRPTQVHPVEIDYYYNFVTGLALELDALKIVAQDYEVSQLDVIKPKRSMGPQNGHILASTSLPRIGDVPMREKLHLNILEENSRIDESYQSAEQRDFVAALTTAAANDVFDMERFEVLGDTFLKFSISLYLAHKFPKWNEGYLTEVKSKFVSNRNLLYCMMKTDIPNSICSSEFQKVDWLPPLVSIPANILSFVKSKEIGKISRALYDLDLNEEEIMSGLCKTNSIALVCNKTAEEREVIDAETELNTFLYQKSISDKVVADTLEAILGVCVRAYGINVSFRVLEFFDILRDETITNLLDLQFPSPLIRDNIPSSEVDAFLVNYQCLEANLGYSFKNRAYLLKALTHPSYPTNRITGCYQELEFIGDAVLDFVISCYIFEKCLDLTPGQLTDLRSALVNNVTLACICVRHRFHLFLLSENAILSESIKHFDDFQQTQDYAVTEPVKILMEEGQTREKKKFGYNLASNVDVPKALGDIFEALIAAVYLDSRDLKCTWNVIYRLMEIEINDFIRDIPINPIRHLNEYHGANPQYSDPVEDDDNTVMVQCTFTCRDVIKEVSGFGRNKTQAKLSACKMALQILLKN